MLSPRGAADDVRMPEVPPQEVLSSPRGAAPAVAESRLTEAEMAIIAESSLTEAEKAAYIKMDGRLRAAKVATMDDDSSRVTGVRDSAMEGLDHPNLEGIDEDRLGLHVVRAKVAVADDHEASIRYSENMEYHGLDDPFGLGTIGEDDEPGENTPQMHPALVSMDEKLRRERAKKRATLAAGYLGSAVGSGDKGSTSSDRPGSPVDGQGERPVSPVAGKGQHKVSLFHRFGGNI